MDDGSLSEVDGARTNFSDGFRVVTDVKDGRARRNNVLDFVFALSFETRVTDAQRFIDNQNVRFNIDVDRKAQAHFHTTGVCSDRLIDVVAQLSEFNDFFLNLFDVYVLQTENVALEIDVFATGHLHRKACGQFDRLNKSAMARGRENKRLCLFGGVKRIN